MTIVPGDKFLHDESMWGLTIGENADNKWITCKFDDVFVFLVTPEAIDAHTAQTGDEK